MCNVHEITIEWCLNTRTNKNTVDEMENFVQKSVSEYTYIWMKLEILKKILDFNDIVLSRMRNTPYFFLKIGLGWV